MTYHFSTLIITAVLGKLMSKSNPTTLLTACFQQKHLMSNSKLRHINRKMQNSYINLKAHNGTQCSLYFSRYFVL